MLRMFESIKVRYDSVYGRFRPVEVRMGLDVGVRVTRGTSPTGGHDGANKTVFFFDKYVVKFDDGYCAEAKLFIEEADRPHFAKVVYVSLDKRWYVQERVDCEPNVAVTREQAEFARNLGWKYNVGDIGCINGEYYGAPDGRQIGHNFTLDLQGNVVIYDYS